ncbi:uncharacterized protein K452DRAFT_308295 [Aplosporella prunicola CBS 121167]|uniref:Uncharacterized protein n=1 Tax=Aplosporella prunicola CBS 121167 TaxID=1176127 RepID=A0A6A6BGU4_9PEZI|nr:uncharacterized protein K452DRAFT_308295 [Aplosporella prunicola CBS 121167]KAF2142653.1 hypothetical protein K452DRAFT_308295 [Aplosporella prunicola CBS 121167]
MVPVCTSSGPGVTYTHSRWQGFSQYATVLPALLFINLEAGSQPSCCPTPIAPRMQIAFGSGSDRAVLHLPIINMAALISHFRRLSMADVEDFIYSYVKCEYARYALHSDLDHNSRLSRLKRTLQIKTVHIPQAARWKAIGRAFGDMDSHIPHHIINDTRDCIRLLEARDVDPILLREVLVAFAKENGRSLSTRATARRLLTQHLLVRKLWFEDGAMFARSRRGQKAMDWVEAAEDHLIESRIQEAGMTRVTNYWRVQHLSLLARHGSLLDLRPGAALYHDGSQFSIYDPDLLREPWQSTENLLT